jgi:DNA-binding transcriptional ArsR family regulator
MADQDNNATLERALAHTLTTMDNLSLVGYTIPFAWRNHILTPHGKPHLVAMHLLADIIYWYQPDHLYDENTGEFLKLEKRFQGKRFCHFAEAFEENFGLTSEQVSEGLALLGSLGLITYELSYSPTNQYLSGKLYAIGIHADEIARISKLTFEDANNA